jgi:hypothetical protein
MFNNVVLDVAIGLIFIYLLYSLLASTINEFIAMLFAYRHRMLEKGIEQMLDGKNYSYYWWDKLVNIIKWLFSTKAIKAAYEHDQGKISAESDPIVPVKGDENVTIFKKLFERKVIETASKPDRSKMAPIRKKFLTTYEKVKAPDVKAKVKPASYVKRAKLNKKASLFAANIINHPIYRRKSEQSILFKKPSYLSASAFSDILMDILSNRKSNISGAPILMNDIKLFVSQELKENPDLKSIFNLYIEQANGDVQKFKYLLENWYDDTMERVSGWYKRQAMKVLFVIGLLLAIIFNLSTIEVVGKLSADKSAREALVKNASDYVKGHYIDSNGHVRITSIDPSKGTAAGSNMQADNATFPADTGELKNVKKALEEMNTLYKESIEQSDTVMGFGWGDYGYTQDRLQQYLDSAEFQKAENIYQKSLNKNKKSKATQPHIADYLKPGFWYKIEHVLYQTFSKPRNLLGFLITALAITLGAPFWFDLLNKFVNIRAGGNAPNEKDNKTPASKTLMLNQKPKPNSFG